MARTYTDEERVSALAALEVNAGNVSRASRAVGIPRPTIIMWRDAAIEATPSVSESLTRPDTQTRDWADLFGQAARLGAEIITENLQRYRGKELSPSDLRNVAVVSGIAVDKHLDYRDGRKAGVSIDQSQNLTLPPGTSLDDLKALRDGLRQ